MIFAIHAYEDTYGGYHGIEDWDFIEAKDENDPEIYEVAEVMSAQVVASYGLEDEYLEDYAPNYYDYLEGEKGKVLGAWDTFTVNGVERRRYYYSLRYYKNQWLEVDGDMYYFDNNGYALVGKRACRDCNYLLTVKDLGHGNGISIALICGDDNAVGTPIGSVLSGRGLLHSVGRKIKIGRWGHLRPDAVKHGVRVVAGVGIEL